MNVESRLAKLEKNARAWKWIAIFSLIVFVVAGAAKAPQQPGEADYFRVGIWNPASPPTQLDSLDGTKLQKDFTKGFAKAWCYFNTATGQILGSYNVESVTPGEYVVVKFH